MDLATRNYSKYKENVGNILVHFLPVLSKNIAMAPFKRRYSNCTCAGYKDYVNCQLCSGFLSFWTL